ncbi:NAD(P)H-dependent glycerol-3-phosphate dehydrogenase [Polynucleobacter sp. UK-Mo-2m-Kol15]|uniref:NAD(P)H-dependent glycerol-3-phosphate dehydrogenase n=1 Tax=Polynucleobacter sp. UK-Mo-2m-Kol15 TaxID=2576916 RepID=UPI001C0E1E4F|nr:NAD(P)H-dependent glycerol-3-phosphate dehydrogenase [Polynucleobacter sp. UK-Mo-2m-Kol15]MBU3574323.1 NAD(P)-dependent glycerol-3-phosphate dehydrogenase [Polynucleobacter sp. UK-Mo-2m-Kol15]
MKVTLLGAGSWGTAMAAQAAHYLRAGDVCLWSRSAEQLEGIRKSGENVGYLPGVILPKGLHLEVSFEQAIERLSENDLLVIATPMSGLSETVAQVLRLATHPLNIVWLCKGLEPSTTLLPHQVVEREDQLHSHGLHHFYGALSGPSFAQEVGNGMPCALTIASKSNALCDIVQDAFHHGNMRIYASDDLVGVELGGAIKNVLAIAAGIGDGLNLGLNARAAVLTRGLAEMMRLVKAVGGRPETCMGLTGVGDLILTATGDLSRNRRVGLALAAGKPLPEILDNLGHVAEGVLCASAVGSLAQRLGVEMPITAMMGEVLSGKLSPHDAVKKLMGRDPKVEV